MSFAPERKRVLEAEGPGVLTGPTTARVGNEHFWRDARESAADFERRVRKAMRARGVWLAPVDCLWVEGGRR
jgi:hypothetical protein